MKIVADQFADSLPAADVKRIYGIVGDSPNGITDAQRRRGAIVVRFSQGACDGERSRRRQIAIVRLSRRDRRPLMRFTPATLLIAGEIDHGRANSDEPAAAITSGLLASSRLASVKINRKARKA